MRRAITLLALCLAGPAFALDVAVGKKSSYQIVVPDGSGNRYVDGFVELGGKVIRTAILKAAGAALPVVRESKMIPGKPAIFVGNTRALKKNGLSSEKFAPWEHAIRVKGKNIFVYGKDEGNPLKKVRFPHYFIYYVNGSLKAACTFVERFANTRFVGPRFNAYGEHDGVRTLPLHKITLPDDFSYRRNPRFRNRVGDVGGLLYSVANNYLFDAGTQYSVHFHAEAIPQKKYYKKHPEYFALINGKRYFHHQEGGIRPQYCLTNPAVQKLIYEEALSRADSGLRVVELGQSDGFKGCECAKCKAWYNTSDWGEKLWCFHRDMAQKLQKDRPDVTVAIAAYGPTNKLPRTFKKFPGKGVIIDLAPASPQLIRGFRDFNIRGLVAWTYYFGAYKACGYSPANPFSFLQREAKWLHKSPVSSFYHCGLGESPSLTGPWVYIWGKLHEEPGLDIRKTLREYCLFAFGKKAAPHFCKFFTLIDKRMEKHALAPLKIEGGDGDDFSGTAPQDAVGFWNSLYPAPVMAELDKHFFAGVKAADSKNPMVKNLRVEYGYLRRSAAVCNAVAAMEKDNTYTSRCRLADAIEARNRYLSSLPLRKGEEHRIDGQAFYGHNIHLLRQGGFMYGIFRGAFNSDPAALRQQVRDLELTRVKDLNDPLWEKIPAQKLYPLQKGSPVIDADFKAAFNDKALLFKFSAPLNESPAETKLPRDSHKLWDNAVWEMFFATGRDIRQLVFGPAAAGCYDSIIYSRKSKDRVYTRWNPRWQWRSTVRNGIWTATVTLPFSIFNGTLKPGVLRQMQIGFSTPRKNRHLYAWNISLTSAFADISGFGKLRIGPRSPEKVRVLDKLADFTPADKKGLFKNWRANPGNLPLSREGNSLKLEAQVKNYLGIYNQNHIYLEPDETAQITIKVRGKGRACVSTGWFDNAGNWVVNRSAKEFPLSKNSRIRIFEFKVGEHVARGAFRFQLVIFLQKPGGMLILDEVKIKIKR